MKYLVSMFTGPAYMKWLASDMNATREALAASHVNLDDYVVMMCLAMEGYLTMLLQLSSNWPSDDWIC